MPSFLATARIVPTPCSYSRLICSNSSTFQSLAPRHSCLKTAMASLRISFFFSSCPFRYLEYASARGEFTHMQIGQFVLMQELGPFRLYFDPRAYCRDIPSNREHCALTAGASCHELSTVPLSNFAGK